MAKKKRRRKRSGANRFEAAKSSRPPDGETTWSQLEQAFFESAPPDNPGPPAEPPNFDDLSDDLPREVLPQSSMARLVRFLVTLLRREPIEQQLPG
jgi:hypothetical protein